MSRKEIKRVSIWLCLGEVVGGEGGGTLVKKHTFVEGRDVRIS